MKKILALLLTLILFALNIFAADVSETQTSDFWLEKAKNEALEYLNMPLTYIKLNNVKYFAKHINDDAFYRKLCEGDKLSRFVDVDKWDIILDEKSNYLKSGFLKVIYYRIPNEANSRTDGETHYDMPLPLNDEWFAALDEALLSGELGNIKNVSFLSYDVDNRRGARVQIGLGGPYPEIDESLWDNVTEDFYSAWFAYIESDTGEYLFPCVIEGDMGIESGKVYELYECAEIMNANIYVVEDFYAELVEDDTPNVWCFLAAFVIVLSGICIAVVLIRKAKKKKGA